MQKQPTIVCLCGSTKFKEEFIKQSFLETMRGKIVLSVGHFGHIDNTGYYKITEEDKIKLDELHKRKIDLADEVFILNVNGYIGKSTQSELDYARKCNKKIKFLENF